MYVYIYDDYLSEGKYNRVIGRVETRLTDLGLSGKIIRLSGIKNIKGTIQSEIRLGAKTIIAVGNNQTINKVIGAMIEADAYGDFQQKTLLGIIPIGDDNSIAESFGIKNENEACNILLARRVEKIDLGLANNYYFLNQVSINSAGTSLKINDYELEIANRGKIQIINLLGDKNLSIKSNPHDGLLDLYIKNKKHDETFLRSKKIMINNQKEKLLIDNVLTIDLPAEISVIKNKINIIVGKDRLFE